MQDYIIGNNAEIRKQPEVLDSYMEDFETNKKLLELTNKILESFFLNTILIRQDENNMPKMTLHKFFAKDVWSNECQVILGRIISTRKQELAIIKESFMKAKIGSKTSSK